MSAGVADPGAFFSCAKMPVAPCRSADERVSLPRAAGANRPRGQVAQTGHRLWDAPQKRASRPNPDDLSLTAGNGNRYMSRRYYAGIFCLSLATLLLELAFMRVLSVANWYHFGFLVISMALLGFGTSGVVLTLWTKLREKSRVDGTLAALSLSFGAVTLLSCWLMQHIPFEPFHLRDSRQFFFIPLYYAVVAAPFFCSGLAIGLLLFHGRGYSGRLYAADLLGAALGCAAIAFVMPVFGGTGSVVIAAALGFLAASIFGSAKAKAFVASGMALGILAVLLAWAADAVIPISLSAGKWHPLRPTDRTPLYTAWNTFSRVDLYDLPAAPEKGWPDPGFSIMIDAGAGTGIANLNGGVREYLQSSHYHPPGVPYIGKVHPKVLILGSGAGREVLEALYFGARSVTAVDINPIINDIVARRMRSAWGGLFGQPEVNLVTEDGRSFIQRSKEKFDVIISIQTMTAAAVTSGALVMSESYMFTREAFSHYIDHLTPDGVILITRGFDQIVKLFATARELFEERGLGIPANHLFAFEGPLAPFGHQLFNQVFLFKKSPWTAEELRLMSERLGIGHPERWFGRSPKIYYSPGMAQPSPEDHWSTLPVETLSAPNLGAFYNSHRENFAPASDDRPFFNQMVRWAGLRVVDSRGTEVVLIVMLLQASAMAFVFILFPLRRFASHGLKVPRPWTFLVYFAGLGVGFIMIEIVFIQRFLLFFGEPVYTFAVVLAGLLGFAGIGSLIVGGLAANHRGFLLWTIPAILAVLLLTTVLSSRIFTSGFAPSVPWRIVIVLAMLAPLGILLGMPFPIGLRIVAEVAPSFVPWAWGVNGFFTVIGSIGASILAMATGFTAVLAFSGVCYFVALLAITAARRMPATSEEVLGPA